jgi:uncharacterized lipoprotein NlpE involved in copper resistance
MINKRVLSLILVFIALLFVLAGCKNKPAVTPGTDNGGSGNSGYSGTDVPALPTPTPEPYVPEKGTWHAEVLFSSSTLKEVMPWYVRIPIAIFAGNTAFEVDVEISPDGTFSYETNTQALKDSVSGTVSTIINYFVKEFDFSVFIDNAAAAVLPETVMGKERDCFGTYERSDDGMFTVTTTTGELLYFKVFGKKLVQLDAEGNHILVFKKSS